MPTPSAAFVPTAGYSRAIHSRSVGAKGARSGRNNSPSGDCVITRTVSDVLPCSRRPSQAEAEAAGSPAEAEAAQQRPKRSAASRIRGRSSPAEAEAAGRPAETGTETERTVPRRSNILEPQNTSGPTFRLSPNAQGAACGAHRGAPLLCDVYEEVNQLVAVTPLIVIPANQLDERRAQLNASLGIWCCLHPSALRAADLLQIHARSPSAPCAWMEGGGLGELAREHSRCSS